MMLKFKLPKIIKSIIIIAGYIILGIWIIYMFGMFYYDINLGLRPGVVSVLFTILIICEIVFLKQKARILAIIVSCLIPTIYWLTISPSNDREWVSDKALLPRAIFEGDMVTIYNIRDAEYPGPLECIPKYVDKTYDLSKVSGMDLMNCYWTNDLIAHPMMSWRFSDGKSFTISIENRNEVGEGYSVFGGFYKQFELIYIVSTDRDAVHRRATYDPEDRVYMYMLDVTPKDAREFLLDYLRQVNELYDDPSWYNTLTNNCTTTIRIHEKATQDFPTPWNWGIVFPGLYCKSIYNHGGMVSDLPYLDLAEKGFINSRAIEIGMPDDFWIQIRKDLPGYENYFKDN